MLIRDSEEREQKIQQDMSCEDQTHNLTFNTTENTHHHHHSAKEHEQFTKISDHHAQQTLF